MQTTGNLVRSFIELTPGVQNRQHDLKRRTILFLVHSRGNTATVITNCYRVILVNRYFDIFTITG